MTRLLRPVRRSRPINSKHRLNAGRVAWWLPLPGLDGHVRLWDVGPGNYATILESGWAWATPDERKPGAVALSTSGAQGIWLAIDPTPPFTVHMRFKVDTLSKTHILFMAGVYTPDYWMGHYFSVGTDGSIAITSVYISDFAASGPSAAGLIAAGQYYDAMAVFESASSRKLYLNGVLVASNTTTANVTVTSSVIGRTIINNAGYTDHSFVGAFSDLSIWNRAFSADEAYEHYLQAQGGYPDLLNRLPRMVLGEAAVTEISGAAAIIDEADTTSATAQLALQGAGAPTDGADAATGQGALAITGAGSAQDADDALSGQGSLAITGTASVADGADTIVARGAGGTGLVRTRDRVYVVPPERRQYAWPPELRQITWGWTP